MITDDERAAIAARWAADPPEPAEPEVSRLAALLTSWRLRIARDRARHSITRPPTSQRPPGRHRVNPKEPPGEPGRNHQGAKHLGAASSGAGDRV